MFGIGMGELVVILVILLVLFGPTQLPKLMRSIGEGIRLFKKSVSGEETDSPK